MTKHGEEQAVARDGPGDSDEAMNDAVENPESPPTYLDNETYRYDGADAVVVLNAEGRVVTTWPTGSRGWRHE